MPGERKIYWDSCVYIGHLKGEDRGAVEAEAIQETLRLIKRRQIVLVASVLVITEVLQCHLPAGVDRQFEDIFYLDNISKVVIDSNIAKLAHDIRQFYLVNRVFEDGEKIRTVSVPDALHLATAIAHGASEFHTYDQNGRGGSIGLLRLGESVAGYKLSVCSPASRMREPRLL
jgi:predicted nucleic acid-binding protein